MAFDCANINIEDFINEIESWSAIWDLKHDDYSNKNAKRNAWEAVISKFVPNFNNMSEAEKRSIGNLYQRKWKSLRDSYTRELAKQKNDFKLGSAAKYRKKYIFFNQLRFLDTTTKVTDDSIHLSDHEENVDEIGAVAEENINKRSSKEKPKKRQSDENHLLEILKKKYYQQETKKHLDYENEDRLFLLSLCKDLQSIPDHMKLNVKSQIMNVIASAKQTACVTSSVQLYPLTTLNQYSHPIRPQFNVNSYSSQPAQSGIQTNVMNRPLNTQPEFGIEVPVYQNQARTQHQNQLWPTTYSPEETSSVQSDLSNDVFSN